MKHNRFQKEISRGIYWCVLVAVSIIFPSCSEFNKPVTEPFYSQTAPPQKREFRWSNGKIPKSFDPALASSPPETDIVRALFDGLTEGDSKTLEPKPSVALKWDATDDNKTWTFHLRKDAKWTNGERVTAKDFVRSWERIARLGDRVPQRKLFENIVGMGFSDEAAPVAPELENELLKPESITSGFSRNNANVAIKEPEAPGSTSPAPPSPTPIPKSEIGVVAVDSNTLKVSLRRGDKDFPSLVSHPVFRPVYGDGSELETTKLNAGIISCGAFRVTSIGPEGITLDRSETNWDRENVKLDRVRFVPSENAEKALEAYRVGDIDAVTNAHFEPLALKLLKPFEDFRQTTHSAVNFYEFNQRNAPFSDRRVREALALAIERERLTEGEMEGSTRPANSFLPFGDGNKHQLVEDREKARKLLEEAGFPNGENFPIVRLVINRNDVQQRVARLVAKMWEDDLKIKTTIVPVEAAEIEKIRISGEFDLIRRGVVFSTADETAAMLAIFARPRRPETIVDPNATPSPSPTAMPGEPSVTSEAPLVPTIAPEIPPSLLTHESAIIEFPAIPLYFPTSYSLVKPYIGGFEMNVFDAPLLKEVRVDTNWQPSKPQNPS